MQYFQGICSVFKHRNDTECFTTTTTILDCIHRLNHTAPLHVHTFIMCMHILHIYTAVYRATAICIYNVTWWFCNVFISFSLFFLLYHIFWSTIGCKSVVRIAGQFSCSWAMTIKGIQILMTNLCFYSTTTAHVKLKTQHAPHSMAPCVKLIK